MNLVQRFFRRYIFSMIGILVLFLAVNFVLVVAIVIAGYMSGSDEAFSVQVFSEHLRQQGGIWSADEAGMAMLRENDVWAMVLDEDGRVVWEHGLPKELPRSYTSADVAAFSRWYLQEYPVKVWGREDGCLTVVGWPQGTWIKYCFSFEWPYMTIMIVGCVAVFFINLALTGFLILQNTRRVEKAMTPILQGLWALGRGKPIHLEESGQLARIKAGVNRAGDYLTQKDNTRAEWIRGVSHDIRTPLSMVLGYASELEDNDALPAKARQQAGIIRRQGERMKALVEDLNLTTKLEYGLWPIQKKRTDFVEICRQAVSGVLNDGLPEQYEITFEKEHLNRNVCVDGDAALLRRALDNLIRNSIVHNFSGCRIDVSIKEKNGICICTVSDDGTGIQAELLKALNQGKELSDSSVRDGTEHGLGLKLVRQIVKAHGGTVLFEPASPHGLRVCMTLPEIGMD